jgi:hypothetical protein
MAVATELLAIGVITGVLLAIVVWFLQAVFRRWEHPPIVHHFNTRTPKPDDYWDTTLKSPRTPRENAEVQPKEPRLSLTERITHNIYPYYKHE